MFTIQDYIDSAYDQDIFRDMELPKILLEEIGEEKLLKVLKRYCEESEDLAFNESDEELPAIYDCDYYEEYEMNKPSEDENEDEYGDESLKEYNEILNKIPNDKCTYVFFGDTWDEGLE